MDLKTSPIVGVVQSVFPSVGAATLEKMLTAALTGLPLFLGGIGCLFAGTVATPLARKVGSLPLVRKRLATIGCFCAAGFLLVSLQISNPVLAIFFNALASFSNDLLMPSAWATCMDIGGRYAGTVSGCMNMMGNLAAALYAKIASNVLASTHNDWKLLFYGGAIFYVVAALSWAFIDPSERLDPGGEKAPA